MSGWIDVNGSHSRMARLGDFAPDVAGDVLEVVVGVRDDAPVLLFVCQQLAHCLFELASLVRRDQSVRAAILRVRVAAEVDTATKLTRTGNDRHQLIEVVSLDDRIESDPRDADLTHSWDRAHDLGAQSGNAACRIVTVVQIIE